MSSFEALLSLWLTWGAPPPGPGPTPGVNRPDPAGPADPADPADPPTAPPDPARAEVESPVAAGDDAPSPPEESIDSREPKPGPRPETPPTDVATTQTTVAPGGDPDLSEIFGTAEEHSDVEIVNEPPEPPSGKRLLPGRLETRWRIVTSAYLDVHRTQEVGFGRQENRLEFYFAYTPNDHIQIVGDIEPVFMGVSQATALDDLASRQMLTPFHVESDAAYVALLDLLPGLDVKVGRQTLVWGTADKFNPTNNINSDDLEDRPLFTEPIANQMVVTDVAPWGDKLWFQGVYVPLFYPALLPPSASTGLQDPQSPAPFATAWDQKNIETLQSRLDGDPSLVPEVRGHVIMPKTRFVNGQAAAKVGWHFWEVDMSLSYYYGRHDIPTPVNVESTQTKSIDPATTPQEELVEGCCFMSDAYLVYPRMQVVGLDFATALPFLGDMGLWGEAGLFFPEAQSLRIEFPIPVNIIDSQGSGALQSEMTGLTIRKTPFLKATAGVDHTFGKHVYVQAQYLRGMIDDFGAGHVGNYLVGGTDLIFFGRHLILRLFAVGDFPTGKEDWDGNPDKGSFVLFPEIIAVPPWGFLTFELGSFILFGEKKTKFGQPAAGTSIAFLKATGAF